ncbi:MAG: glutamate--tRNA ligase, partial [Desulfurococcaceae archaeon]
HVKSVMLKPVGLELEERTLYIERRVLNEKVDSIVQLYRIGFARVDSVHENAITLIFAHE